MARGHTFLTLDAANAVIDAILAVQPTETVTMVRNGVVVGTRSQATVAPVLRRTTLDLVWMPAERRFTALGGQSDGTTTIPLARDAVDVTLDATPPVVRPRSLSAAVAGVARRT